MTLSKRYLERELLGFLGPGRDAHIAARYYGFDGLGGGTLLNVGQEVGLTRERIRQIVTTVSTRLSTAPPISRTLDRTIAFVHDRMPTAAEEIEAELHSQGLTSGLFRLEGIIRAAELLGRRVRFSITEAGGKRLVHAQNIPSFDTVVRIARRVIAHRGMATLSDIVAEVRSVEPGVCDKYLVASVLCHREGFCWLDRSAGWFWLSNNPNNNPVLNRIRKILSVANPINITELRAGIARDYRMEGFSPPKRVLLEFCRHAPGLDVYNNTISAKPGFNPDDALTKAERDLARILSKHGGTMAQWELKSLCLDTGMNSLTFFHSLEYSPIISKYAVGLYGLIGSGEKTWYRVTDRRRKEMHTVQPIISHAHATESNIVPSGLLRVHQVAKILGMSPRGVHYHARTGSLKGSKIGPKIWHFHIQDVYEFKARMGL